MTIALRRGCAEGAQLRSTSGRPRPPLCVSFLSDATCGYGQAEAGRAFNPSSGSELITKKIKLSPLLTKYHAMKT